MTTIVKILERDGGRILAAFTLLVIAGAWSALRLPKSDELVIAAITLIARELMGNQHLRPEDSNTGGKHEPTSKT